MILFQQAQDPILQGIEGRIGAAARIAARPEASEGAHRYDAIDFGLSEDEIRERFGSYVDAFELRPDRRLR